MNKHKGNQPNLIKDRLPKEVEESQVIHDLSDGLLCCPACHPDFYIGRHRRYETISQAPQSPQGHPGTG